MNYRISVRSRHESHEPIRNQLVKLPFRSVVRFGSNTTNQQISQERIRRGLRPLTSVVECNTVEAVKNSSNKLLMKQKFRDNNVKTAAWYTYDRTFFLVDYDEGSYEKRINDLPYPIVAKHIYGSRGTGNTLIKNAQEMTNFLNGKTHSNYIFEKFYNYNREYRLHVDSEGCFYACRKLIKNDTPEDQRWYRNDSNCVWIMEDNESFSRPNNWDSIISESVKALKAVGLDIGAIDLKIQSNVDGDGNNRPNPEFIILETNSAPSFGTITLQKYTTQLPIILKRKYENR